MLVKTADLLKEATTAKIGLPAFNVLHLETAEALAQTAEETSTGIVLQISQNCVAYHGGLKPLAIGALAIAEESTARLALHLDHAEDLNLVREALDLGFSSVMYDGSTLDYADNVRNTKQVVSWAHSAGAIVEAEIGEIGGKEGAHAPGVKTDPHEAHQFWTDTGVDALAVAVGSTHAMLQRSAELDIQRIQAIAELVRVPLVLHGSSGVDPFSLRAGIRAGMVKINVSTQLNKAFTAAVRDQLAKNPELVDSRKYLGAGRSALNEEAQRLVRIITLKEH